VRHTGRAFNRTALLAEWRVKGQGNNSIIQASDNWSLYQAVGWEKVLKSCVDFEGKAHRTG
jgi:hypothetical protein